VGVGDRLHYPAVFTSPKEPLVPIGLKSDDSHIFDPSWKKVVSQLQYVSYHDPLKITVAWCGYGYGYGWTIGVLGFDSRRGLGIFLFTTASRTALGPTQPPIQWVTGALSLGIKRPGREADHSHPPSVEVKNAWSYTSTPRYAFMAWCLINHRGNFTFLPLLVQHVLILSAGQKILVFSITTTLPLSILVWQIEWRWRGPWILGPVASLLKWRDWAVL
jgi:hypothetical protein